ncbi:aminotransferase class V-fold PLP-dependent enzyme [Mesoterricola silvestris]|uniref:cysteine desulfurase n=1 Tax=Mesoterricola silvestris TaxID=2927979 RepID=A0AA48GP27_9BACT|nr:aminotransferase class V-fold PLP-dependent enzyme [Mesoterricola silvestris]BDU74919.1 cysteine desulfurase [Mesoterricola silvestris]
MIYLDNAATSHPKAPGVAEAVASCLASGACSPARASHRLARDASRVVFETREACAALLGAAESERLVFTRNATEALNLAILGSVPDGGTVAVSSLEHNAVMRPLRHLEATRGVRVRVIPFDALGRPDPVELKGALWMAPDLLVLTAASNVTGCLTPVAEVAALCRRLGVPICVDASQCAGHLPLPSGCDFVAFSGHKGLLGPPGTGGLLLGPGARPAPLILGGTGSASESEAQPDFLPDRFEAGTPNVPALAGLGAALRFLDAEGPGLHVRERALCEDLARGLLDLPGVTLLGPGPGEDRAPVLSITVQDRDLGELALELDRLDICTRMGLHCAPAAHRSLGTLEAGGALRFSPGFATTPGEIRETLEAMKELLA